MGQALLYHGIEAQLIPFPFSSLILVDLSICGRRWSLHSYLLLLLETRSYLPGISETEDEFHNMLGIENPAYLLKMTEAFFSEPKSKPGDNSNGGLEASFESSAPPGYSQCI